jgi:hypothetical protein
MTTNAAGGATTPFSSGGSTVRTRWLPLLTFAVALAGVMAWALDSWGMSCDHVPDSRFVTYLCLHPRLHFVGSLVIVLGVTVVIGRGVSATVRGLPIGFLLPLALLALLVHEARAALWLTLPLPVLRHRMVIAWALFAPAAFLVISTVGTVVRRGRRTNA